MTILRHIFSLYGSVYGEDGAIPGSRFGGEFSLEMR